MGLRVFIFSGAVLLSLSAAPRAQTMRFVAFGDSRTNLGDWQAACAAVNAENPDMVLHTGDLWDGFSPSQWISAVQANPNLNALLGSNKFLATWGNHESNGQLIAVSPSVVRGGSGLFHFQESGVFMAALGDVPDVGYLTTALASQDAQTADWKFIIHHRPVYSAGEHGAGGNGSVESLCDQHGVAISFAGHDHHYERTKLIFGGSVTQTASASDYAADEQGTIYIVTGGAGAPLRSVGSNWWTAPGAASALHYCLVSVYADRIDVDVKDLSGRVIDQFTRRKGLPDPGPFTLDVTSGTGGSVTRTPDAPEYDRGTEVTLTAVPETGYTFAGWGEDASGTENPLTITLTRNQSVTAAFFQPGNNIWHSYDIELQNGSPQAVCKSTSMDAEFELYQSANTGGVNLSSLFSAYSTSHADAFNFLSSYWSNGSDYPYIGTSNVQRGSGTGESNTPDPAGVYDIQFHPPDSDNLAVAAFTAPVGGEYKITGLAARRVHDDGSGVSLKVFGPDKLLITELVSNSRIWSVDGQVHDLGTLSAGDRIFFAADRVGSFNYDAMEAAWTIHHYGEISVSEKEPSAGRFFSYDGALEMIVFHAPEQSAEIRIYTFAGKPVGENAAWKNGALDVRRLLPGVYTLQFRQIDGTVINQRMAKY